MYGHPDVALLGQMQSGKDTLADFLVKEHGYVRVAFADKLKLMALETDPLVHQYMDTDGWHDLHLADAVATHGWEFVKATYPAARKFLQNFGVAMRNADDRFWIDRAQPAIDAAHRLGRPVVVTDTRFRNEAYELGDVQGFMTCRITRQGATGDSHVSETELSAWPTDRTISNNGSLDRLYRMAGSLLLSA